jgi:hypothetical protein
MTYIFKQNVRVETRHQSHVNTRDDVSYYHVFGWRDDGKLYVLISF